MKKLKEKLASSNIVPIAVALITAFSGWKVTEYRITQLENKFREYPTVQVIDLKFDNLEDKIDNFVSGQQGINDTLLKMMQSNVSSLDTNTQKKLDYHLWTNYKDSKMFKSNKIVKKK